MIEFLFFIEKRDRKHEREKANVIQISYFPVVEETKLERNDSSITIPSPAISPFLI